MITQIDNRNQLPLLLPKNAIGCEIGVQHGDYAVTLYHIAKPKTFYLVDLWELLFPELKYNRWDNFYEEVKSKFIDCPNVKLVKSSSVDFLQSLQDDELDWLYLDSSHTYYWTSKELDLACKKVKKNGIIAGHDFVVAPNAWESGVIRAVMEVIQSGRLYMTHITNEQFPSFVCKVLK